MAGQEITRAQLADLLNEDLSREYQAIIAYVVYSQVLKGAEYMSIAAQLEVRLLDVVEIGADSHLGRRSLNARRKCAREDHRRYDERRERSGPHGEPR